MKRTIGILSGGDSPERSVSLTSGRGVYEALQARGHEARLLEIASLDDLVPALNGIDVVFNVLHGGSGEDGTVQMLLDVMEIPYAGSGPLASARAMDKAQAKALFRSKDLPTPDSVTATAATLEDALRDAETRLPFPLIVKPQSGGSTIAVSRVSDATALRASVLAILDAFDAALIESFISGRELTAGILRIDDEDIALPVIEIRFTHELFDFEAKYTDGEAEFLAPAPIADETASQVQSIALEAHHALGCHGYSRVDFRLSEDGIPYLLEVNTLPGMTPLSDLPRAAALIGIDYGDLVERMLKTATTVRPASRTQEGEVQQGEEEE